MLLTLLGLEAEERAQWMWWSWWWWSRLEVQGLEVQGLEVQGLAVQGLAVQGLALQWLRWANRFHNHTRRTPLLLQPTAADLLRIAP